MAKSVLEGVSNVNPAFDIPLRKARGCVDVRVTPEIAQHWLGFNISNRDITQAKIKQYRSDMERGEWRDQGEAIRFAYGKLLDGQHRLIALTLADATVPMLVVHGLDPEVQANMDTGRPRTAKDVLTIESMGSWEGAVFGTAVHTIINYQRGLSVYSTQKALNREVRNFYLENRARIESAVQFCKSLPRKHPLMPHARIMALYYILSRLDEDRASKFFRAVFAGEGVVKPSAEHFLRERLMAELIERKTRSAYEHSWWLIKTWNAATHGTARRSAMPRNASFFVVRSGEEFPEIRV